MQTLASENTFPVTLSSKAPLQLPPEEPAFSSEDLQLSEAQKRLLMNHVGEWTHILNQGSQRTHPDQQAQPILEIGFDNQKQHLLLLTDRLNRAALKANAIHALQETSEALGKESASVRYYLSALGVTMDLSEHDNITTEIRYYILRDIINICGGTYLLLPQQDSYLDKSDGKKNHSAGQKVNPYANEDVAIIEPLAA